MRYRNYQGTCSERCEDCAATLSLLGRFRRREWCDSERDYYGSISLLRRNLDAVSGWGVKGLLWQQMERPAARWMLITSLTVVCRLTRNAADTWSPGTTNWRWQVLHNAPLPRQNALPSLVVLNNVSAVDKTRPLPDLNWYHFYRRIIIWLKCKKSYWFLFIFYVHWFFVM